MGGDRERYPALTSLDTLQSEMRHGTPVWDLELKQCALRLACQRGRQQVTEPKFPVSTLAA